MEREKYQLFSIGEVNQTEQGFVIHLSAQVKDALQGLKGFSHVQIYWWAHKLDSEEMRNICKVDKPYRKGPLELGIFATRSPLRPNPIAMTVVPVTFMDEAKGVLGISYIDAEPGSPVLDIKPYYGMERVRDYQVPRWCSHWPQWYEDAGSFNWAGEFENAR